MKTVWFFVVCISVITFSVVGQEYVSSPCPGIFSYQNVGGSVYGHIHLKPTRGPVSTLRIRVNFTVAARLTSTYVGQIEVLGNDQSLQKYNRGVPLDYRVHLPVIAPLPRLTAIIVNGDTLCYGPGDFPGPNQYVTTISLDHMLYLKSGAGFSGTDYFNQYERPISSPVYEPPTDVVEYIGPNGEHTQVFTVNDINKGSSWNSDYFPLDPYVVNDRRPSEPVYETSKPRPSRPTVQNVPQSRPSRPRPQPEVYSPPPTTQPPPPPPPPPAPTPIPSTPSRLPAFPTAIECGVISGGNERIPLIYQGHSYPRGDLPWLVAVYKRQEGSLTFICSGTLVSERHVITAAHCMHQKSKLSTIKEMVVKVGVYNLEDWGDDISITRTLQAASIHESYNATTLENDILVLTLERTVEFNNYVRPACLWSGSTDQARIVGAAGVVAGWGASEKGPVGQGEPRMVRIPVVSTAACRASKPEFHKLTSARTLCAGDRNGSGPCLGDSGGGLYILDSGRWRLRGIVSLSLRPQNGDNTCNLNEYIVFTDTAQYLGWIRNIITQHYYD